MYGILPFGSQYPSTKLFELHGSTGLLEAMNCFNGFLDREHSLIIKIAKFISKICEHINTASKISSMAPISSP